MLIKSKIPTPKHVYNPQKEELVSIDGDWGEESRYNPGLTMSHHADHGTIILSLQRDPRVKFECEIYPSGEGDHFILHMVCPRCRHALTINSRNKAMDLNQSTGILNVEPSECTWELKPEEDPNAGLLITAGLCRYRFAIENSMVREL